MEEPGKNLENIQTYIDFVKTNLEPLAQQLKVSVEWLWNILVQQARVEAIVYLIVCIALFLTGVSLSIAFLKLLKKATFDDGTYDRNRTRTNAQGYASYVCGIGALILIVISVFTTASTVTVIVTGLVNPEYRAIEKIVEFAKPKVEEVSRGVK